MISFLQKDRLDGSMAGPLQQHRKPTGAAVSRLKLILPLCCWITWFTIASPSHMSLPAWATSMR